MIQNLRLSKSSFLQHKKGIVLIFSFWVLIVLSIFSKVLSDLIFSQVKFAKILESRVKSVYLAKSIFLWSLLERKNEKTQSYDTWTELQNKEMNLDARVYKYTLTDEESKINVNVVSSEILSRLPQIDQDLAEKISASEYKPFKAKEELLLIEGVTFEKFEAFKDLITVYGEGKVNINTASSQVLQILGLSEDLVGKIIQFREGEDKKIGTEDDNIFKNVSTIIEDLKKVTFITIGQEQELLKVIPYLCVKSENFSIKIDTSYNPSMHFEIVFDYKTGKIKYWQQK